MQNLSRKTVRGVDSRSPFIHSSKVQTQYSPTPVTRRPLVTAIAIALSMSMSVAQAAVITLNDDSDVAGSAACNLRNAIISANTDTATGSCTSGSGADVIDLGNVSSVQMSIGQMEVTSDITIEGSGQRIYRNGFNGRLFLVDVASANLTINDVHLHNGWAQTSGGGAIHIGSGATVNVNNSTLSDNDALQSGGAIRVTGDATLNVTNSTFEGNSSSNSTGGAISIASGGTVNLSSSRITNNSSKNQGGGISLNNGISTLHVIDSTFSGNRSDLGGAISVTGSQSTVSLENSTVNANRSPKGGGVFVWVDGTFTAVNSTIADNLATVGGGGIYNSKSSVQLSATTLSGNSAPMGGGLYTLVGTGGEGTLSLSNSIIANSSGGDCGISQLSHTVIATGVNLIEDNSGCTFTSGATVMAADPGFGTLIDNGGPTATLALSAGSPAINAATECFGITTDQRGVGRQGNCDLGAFEYNGIQLQAGPNFEVNSTQAGGDGFCGEQAGECTLEEAINTSNSNPDASVITFASSLTPASATVTLTSGALPRLRSSITIQGGGITIDADQANRVLAINHSTVTLNSLNLINGRTSDGGGGVYAATSNVTINDSWISGNCSNCPTGGLNYGDGGGVYNRYGNVTINNSVISGNTAGGGGGLSSYWGKLVVNNSVVSGNLAAGGAGIQFWGGGGNLKLNNSKVTGNKGIYSGGGVYVSADNFELHDSTVSDNEGGSGAGLRIDVRSTSIITNSTIAGNSSTKKGGGLYLIFGNTQIIENSTITGNSAAQKGGGIFASDIDHLHILDSTITSNSASSSGGGMLSDESTVTLKNSIIANSVGGDCNFEDNSVFNFPSSTNLIEDGSACGTPGDVAGGEVLQMDPLLGPLANNGGATLTHLPQAGSPVINAGTSASGQSTDQRGLGFPRVQFGSIDIGAVEVQHVEVIFKNSFEQP